MAISAGTDTQISETTTEETDRRERYNAFRTEVNKTRDKRILQIFVIAAIEFFGVQVSQIENIKNFSEVYELIETATTKDVAPFIVHEITEFIASIEGLDPDTTGALKKKARAAITDEVDVKSKYPNFDFVLTLGAMVSSMRENDYDKFHEHITKKILKDSQLEMERCMIIHELIQRKHLNLKSNHSNDTRETTPTVDGEMMATAEGPEDFTDPFNENIEKISKWLDQSSCSKNRGFIVKYCKMNGINPPKKGICM